MSDPTDEAVAARVQEAMAGEAIELTAPSPVAMSWTVEGVPQPGGGRVVRIMIHSPTGVDVFFLADENAKAIGAKMVEEASGVAIATSMPAEAPPAGGNRQQRRHPERRE